ncbi:NRAMP family divalent metal transporter [Pseudomonas syringae group genomosp. 3]|uniref:NRAMP family divalent metal transporter n=1 Tax=Pseudomonas syringae group genomosp. 3 TaxID=251701 RepID=UPI000EFFA900|nr:NRAMP family divalent metal transporter [Pseudomonas syringae group genomosp. 3]QQN27496.1 divalent metal cation transporter [Pseudomonas syringae pv. maculicola]RMO78189.1 Membrane protein [Pseudomonas syringae pv. maculicola]
MTTTTKEFTKARRASLVAAVFMMATSAIGPGFLTQTATFTATLGAAFAFGILASILIDFVVQLNVWRIVSLTKMRAADLANAAIPGSGYLLTVLVLCGGLVFMLGNIAGAGLGLNALTGLDPKWGGALSALLAIGIFSSHRAGVAMDRIMMGLGILKICLIVFACFATHPPLGEALRQSVWPDFIDFASITTIVGGTVGGYITYAGAHRLLDRGTVGVENLQAVSRAALTGILVTGIARYVLFLAILGVVASGVVIDVSGKGANPAGQAFQAAAGDIGMMMFGLVLWAAGISSVIGASYTSMSFITVFSKKITERVRNLATVVFIVICMAVYIVLGKPPTALLVFAGGFNGLILPLGLSIFMYVGWARSDLMDGYHYPRWLLVLGILTCLLSWFMAYKSAGAIFAFIGAA